MRRLVLTPRHLHAIERHAASAYPEESCGVLLGRALAESTGGALVERILPARNESAAARQERYLLAAADLAAAERQARSQGLQIVGFYHSHPDHAALPGELDRENAWAGYSYLIVEVGVDGVVDARSFRRPAPGGPFEEESVELPLAGPVSLARPPAGKVALAARP